jgi:hypothetical protein
MAPGWSTGYSEMSLPDAFVDWGGTYKKQPALAQSLPAQNMSFVDELRKDAPGDVFPINAGRTVAREVFVA